MRHENCTWVTGHKLSDLLAAGLAIALLMAIELNFPTVVFGQAATGTINGAVTDTTGAVVPQAKVVLHNVAIGTEQATVTNEVGRYVFPTVLPGPYTLTVIKQGFRTATEPEFNLAVNQTSTHDIGLSVGAVTQQITVGATATQIESSTGELGTAVQRTEVNNLPLNGRNFTQLLALTPGVSPISTGQNAGGGGGFAGNAVGTKTLRSRSRSGRFSLP